MDAALSDRLAEVQARIVAAAARSGRPAEAVTLVAVSKQMPAGLIAAAYALGLRDFGENRSAELETKSAHLSHLPDLRWHMIGTLQARQSLPVAQRAACFHAVDRVRIADRLARQLEEVNRRLPVFIEVNISGEAGKSGLEASRWETDPDQQANLAAVCATIAALPRIEVQGLMTMAPWDAPTAEIRAVFRRTRALAEWLAARIPNGRWDRLSMGMTDDFETAIEEGATHVRIGRAIFGARA